jgi:DNA-directed RNA polymerase subunit RPC12/RpoP
VSDSINLRRHLPGKATQRDVMGRVKFIKGRVDFVGRNIIRVLTDSKQIGELGVVILIGETYVYWCPRCHTNVWEMEKTRSRGACPFCSGQIAYLEAGDRMKLHFRAGIIKDSDGNMIEGGASWWGEKVT